MNTEKELALLNLMHTEWKLLTASVNTLLRSIEKCQVIGEKGDYNFEELESFDSLTSKFNRTSDIFTQKVLRTSWMLLHEPFAPYIDMVNKGEKMILIKSADQLIEIRDLRNQIAHEYIPEAILELVPEVIEQTSRLIENIETCGQFLQSRGWIEFGSF